VTGETLTGIDEGAPVSSTAEIEIAAAAEAVWEVLTDFEGWPTWNPEVKAMSIDGPVAVGTEFRWKAGPGTITSRIERVEPPLLIAWTGKTLGIRAVHFRWFEPREAATFVRTAESYEGLVSRLFRRQLQRVLDNALESGLGSLKDEVERRTARRPTLSAEP
jgi:uncharacterized protein YndB with AHSA1/START domain